MISRAIINEGGKRRKQTSNGTIVRTLGAGDASAKYQ